MDSTDHPLVWALNEEECRNLLARGELGRLAVVADGKPDIFPVNYVVDGRRILFRTAPGTKLDIISSSPDVAFEVDEFDDTSAANVVVKGVARHLDLPRDIDTAENLALTPWIPTSKYRWVSISSTSITGRRFERAPESARYSASTSADRS